MGEVTPLGSGAARSSAQTSLRVTEPISDQPTDALAASRPSFRREIALTRLGIAVTVCAFVAFMATIALGVGEGPSSVPQLGEAAIYVLLVSMLVYGGLTYQLARLGYLRRRANHMSRPRGDLRRAFEHRAPRVATLVPSYREECRVVRQALLSAALQDYPHRRVVLLIDDPPDPHDPADRAALEGARGLPSEVKELLAEPATLCENAFLEFERRRAGAGAPARLSLTRRTPGRWSPPEEASRLAAHFDGVAAWLEEQAACESVQDHADELFVGAVLRGPARDHRATADWIRRRTHQLREDDVIAHYRRLRWLFQAEVTAFERKRFRNLSHAPNKAMNLNSYIALLGSRVAESDAEGPLRLEKGAGGAEIEDAEYVLTLDADSVLLPDYMARLIEVMERPGNERLAVAQTPYSAIPGASRVLERVAGATTDMQYIVHQGFTRHEATFWVGANALLRKAALDDIATWEPGADGRATTKYIQDRTVIEDTESSVDLAESGWVLVNYPERLSYSATPPDYGALVIQRRRWANGGLLILPKLLRHLLQKPRQAVGEAWMRIHYLTSIAFANVAFLALLLFPFDDWLATLWLPLTAVPYFLLYGRDLRQHGYRRGDLLRVYALNVLLVAANLGGVLKSLHQAATGRQTPFKRTPKVSERTPVPVTYLALPCLVAAFLCFGVGWDVSAERWSHAGIAFLNAMLLSYAIARFIGWRTMREDLLRPLWQLQSTSPAKRRFAALAAHGATSTQILLLTAAVGTLLTAAVSAYFA